MFPVQPCSEVRLTALDASCVNRERSSAVGSMNTSCLFIADQFVDRAQPSCGWCARNGQVCEYKERKKPGLRAGYGKELEQRLGQTSADSFVTSITDYL